MTYIYLSQEFIKEKFVLVTEAKHLHDGTLGTNNKHLCKICPEKKEECMGHPGYIIVSEPTINPINVNKAVKSLKNICWNCDEDIDHLFQGLNIGEGSIDPRTIRSHKLICPFCERQVPSDIKWDRNLKAFKEISGPKDNDPKEILDLRRDIIEKFGMRYIPIFPIYNYDIEDNRFRTLLSNISYLFSPSADVFTIYSSITGYIKDRRYFSLSKLMNGKTGLVEQTILGKRLNYCMRSVITPDINLDIDQVSVPEKASRILRLKDGDIILLNRQPSLVKQSILSMRVKIRRDNNLVISFNPYLCRGFNADFDGDEMNIFVPEDNEELPLLLPQNNLFDNDRENLILYPHQDCLWGMSYNENYKENTKRKVIQKIRENIGDVANNIPSIQKEAYRNLEINEASLTNFKVSLRRIIDSGARGSEANWRGMFETLGDQVISENTCMNEKNKKVKNSLESGLNFDEYFLHMQSTRESICSIGVTTALSGHISKKLSRFLEDSTTNETLRYL